jgi:hypothetical protein
LSSVLTYSAKIKNLRGIALAWDKTKS